MKDEFNTSLSDAQGTVVNPLPVKEFDINAYSEYEGSLMDKCREFWEVTEGALVHRRFRVPEVFSWACADKKISLELQLAALNESMSYKMDIPNFLEPWYGIGVVSSAFDVPYIWKDGQAPAVQGPFKTAREAISSRKCDVAESKEGKIVLEMIDFFLDQTKGRIPVSLGDTQSPLNIASSYLMDSTAFMYEIFDHPEDLVELLNLISEMERDFLQKQVDLIGEALVKPGHGFASARCFKGLGFSDDNMLMFSDKDYLTFAQEALLHASQDFEGPVFHSCGNWSDRLDLVKSIPDLIMADGAIGNMTDPSPNDPAVLGRGFANSGIILHARIVGNAQIVKDYVSKLSHKGLKCIITTYCPTPQEQEKAYSVIHSELGSY